MNTVTPGTRRNTFMKKGVFKIVVIFAVLALIAGGAYMFVRARIDNASSAVEQRIATVVKGEIVDSITGSAPIKSSNRSELSPKVTATLEQINCAAGDQVKEGDILFVLDNTDALMSIENTKNNIAEMQLTMDDTANSINDMVIKAPYSGQIQNISIKEGDTANKGSALFTIIDVDNLDVTLAFSGSAVKNISVGQKATVYIQDLMLSVEGKVTYKSSKSYTTSSGGELYNVEISIQNPGSLKEGMSVSAEITAGGSTIESVESGLLSYVSNQVIKSDSGGTVKSLNIRENEFVNSGDVLVVLENDDLILTSSSNEIKMNNLQYQLEIQQKQLAYYTITAPFDGTITKVGTAIEGDTVKQGETLAVLSDMGHLEFSVTIDELDISDIALEQKVNITADAIEDSSTTPLTGKVSEIAMEGNSSNGVTTYDVTVTVDDDSVSMLKTGMNVDCEIFVTDKQDVLMVPLEAVIKMGDKSFVYVINSDTADEQSGQDGQAAADGQNAQNGPAGSEGQQRFNRAQRSNNTSSSASGSQGGQATGNSASTVQAGFAKAAGRTNADTYYKGATLVKIETGISNETYIEILDGLTEGQKIVLPQINISTGSNSSTSNENKNNMGGFMSGKMPSGGGMSGGRIGGF